MNYWDANACISRAKHVLDGQDVGDLKPNTLSYIGLFMQTMGRWLASRVKYPAAADAIICIEPANEGRC